MARLAAASVVPHAHFLGLTLCGTVSGQTKTYRLAIAHPSTPIPDMTEGGSNLAYRELFAELRHLGYIEGKNLQVERYSGEGRTERYAEIAKVIVHSRPDVILAASSRLVQDLKAETSTIPIVGFMADPVAFGVVSSLSRPGGNITGIVPDAGLEIYGKRLDLLKQILPNLSRVGFLVSQELLAGPASKAMREAANNLRVSLVDPPLGTPIGASEYRRVFSALSQEGAEGLIVSDQAEHFTHRKLISELAEIHRIPMVWPYRTYGEFPALIAYGVDVPSLYRVLATQVDQILRGAVPSEMPIQLAVKFALVLNLRIAKALGLTVPPALLAQADEVIE